MSAIPSLQAAIDADYAAWREAMLQWQKEGEQCIKLRDHFAAAALTGLLSNVQRYQNEPLTRQAFEIADFMLRERERTAQKVSESNSWRAVGPEPDSRVWETPCTPQTHATPTQGSVQGEGSFRVSQNANEPVAWAVAGDYGEYAVKLCFDEASAVLEADRRCRVGLRPDYVVVPLYRQPPDWAFLNDEIARLRDAIRRLAGQDATLSVCDGNVTVTMDATLTDAEREAVEEMLHLIATRQTDYQREAHTLRKLLERLA